MNLHECQIEKELDEFSWFEQYIIRCRCHNKGTWYTWRPGDAEFVCPEGGGRDTTNNKPATDV